jgi:hypothetical protein
VTCGAASSRNPAKDRSARSAPPTLPGRSTQPDLVQVTAHRLGDLRSHRQVGPGRQQLWPGHDARPVAVGWPAKTCAPAPRRPCGTGRPASSRPGAGRSGSTRWTRARPAPGPPPAPSRPPAAGSGRCAAARGRWRAPAPRGAGRRSAPHPMPWPQRVSAVRALTPRSCVSGPCGWCSRPGSRAGSANGRGSCGLGSASVMPARTCSCTAFFRHADARTCRAPAIRVEE